MSFKIFNDPVPTVPFGSISAQTEIAWDKRKEKFINGEYFRTGRQKDS